MPHDTPLITTLVAGIGLAFVVGAVAHKFRISPLVGYLLAGVIVGPLTPGFAADQRMANDLAEIGIILLMFGVGLHFSLKDLLTVRSIALPGALGQMAIAAGLGMGLGRIVGWSFGASFLFGLALSVASTVVLLRALQERRILDTERGRIATGWLIVEDLAMVLALVLAPPIARLLDVSFEAGAHAAPIAWGPVLTTVGMTLVKVAAFVALMLIVGRRAIPWLLHTVVHMGSRELFRLAVLAIALCVAYGASSLFGVSFALGAFFAGMVLSESQLSQRAAQETLPLRDAFAVLFFVSVGMLFDPHVLLRAPWALVATLMIIVVGKSATAFAIVRVSGRPLGTALTVSASLGQIGEFSFILASLGYGLGLLPAPARDLILAAAILSILINPMLFAGFEHVRLQVEARNAPAQRAPAPTERPPEPEPLAPTKLHSHAVLIGYGRVGKLLFASLRRSGHALFVIEDRADRVEALRAEGVEVVAGNAADPRLMAAANLPVAAILYVAIPDAFEAGQIIEQARLANPSLDILGRASSDAEVDHLTRLGADLVVMGEREIARAMLAHVGRPTAADAV